MHIARAQLLSDLGQMQQPNIYSVDIHLFVNSGLDYKIMAYYLGMGTGCTI